MDINKFEDQIKNLFDQHQPESDHDEIWKNIEPRLKSKKKRRFLILLLLTFGLGALVLLWRNHERQHSGSATKARAKEKAAQTIPLAGTTTSPSEKTEAVGKTWSSDSIPPKQVDPPFVYTPTNSEQVPSETVIALPENTLGSAAPLAKSPDAATESQITRQPNIDGLSSEYPDLLPSEMTAPNLASLGIKTVPQPEQEEDADKNKKRRQWHWPDFIVIEQAIGFAGGPGYAHQHLAKGTGVTQVAGHLEGRKKTESSLESFNFDIFYTAATKKGFVLKTGLSYRQANEKFFLAYTDKETKTINGIVATTVDADDNVVEHTTGSKVVTQITEHRHIAFNEYRFINFPVGIGYKKRLAKGSREITGGVDFNLFFRASGTIYNNNNFAVALQPGTNTYYNVFRQRTGMGIWGGYTQTWQLTNKLGWQLGAQFQIPLKPVTAPEYQLVQRYFNFGMQVGLVYSIFQR